MKTSYLKSLKVLVAIVYYGSIVALVGVGAMLTLGLVKPQNKFRVSVEIPISLANSVPFSEPGWAGELSSGTESQLALTSLSPVAVQEHIGLYVSMALSALLGMLLVVLVVRQLKQIVDTVGTPDVFSMANVVRIRWLGGFLIGMECAKTLVWLLVRHDVLALMKRNNIQYSNEQFSFGLSNLMFAGLLIIGLAEVFRSGYQLKEESELTI